MGDALACALIEMRHFQAKDFAQFHPGGTLGKRLLTTAHDVNAQQRLAGHTSRNEVGRGHYPCEQRQVGLCVAMVNDKVVG